MMDYDYEDRAYIGRLFGPFVYTTLTVLVFLQVYSYVRGPPYDSESDFSDIKYVIMQLTHSLSEVYIYFLL